jgi:hypothetical protein
MRRCLYPLFRLTIRWKFLLRHIRTGFQRMAFGKAE